MVTDWVMRSMTGMLGNTEIATPLLGIDCRASTALAFRVETVELAHAAHREASPRSRHAVRTATPPGEQGAAAPQPTWFTGASPRATRWMFSAITAARDSIMPSVQPDTWGVISTFGSM
jgi:hypothetical protein